LKVANVRLEVVGGPHFDGEKVMVVLHKLLAGGVLSEDNLLRSRSYGLAWEREQNQLEATPFKLKGKILHKMESLVV